MMRLSIRYTTLIAALASMSVYAAEPVTKLSTVEVNAAEDEGKIDELKPESIRNRYRVPLSNRAGIETFTSKEIEALKPRDIFDLLDKATGITVSYQGRKNPFFVRERGGGTFTYIINGAILPTVTQRILQKIPLKAIEEMQVVRDSTALTLGPTVNIGASGSGDGLNTGYIIIKTKQPKKDEIIGTVQVEKADAQPFANNESLILGKRLNYKDAKGYLGALGSRLDRPSKPEWFDGQNAEAGILTSGFEYGILSVDFMAYADTGRFEMQRAQAGLATAATNQMKWYYDPIDTVVYTLNGNLNWDSHNSSLFSLFQTSFTQTENDTNFPPYSKTITAADNFSNYGEKTRGFSFRHHAQYDKTILQVGVQQTRSWALGSSGPNPSTKWDTDVLGFGVTLEQRLFNDQLSLDAGFRLDEKHAKSSGITSAQSNVDMPKALALSFGARWQIDPVYALNARYFDGSQGNQGSFNIQSLPSTTLHPESQQRMEFGGDAKLFQLFNPSFTWFDVKIDNQKTQTATQYSSYGNLYYYYTESNNHRTGFEFVIKGELGEHSRYKTSWTHMITNTATNSLVSGTTANDLFDISAEHEWAGFVFNVSEKFVGPYNGGGPSSVNGITNQSFAVDGQWHTIGNYVRVDANISREFKLEPSNIGGFGIAPTTLKGTVYARNIGDSHYMTIYPWPDRGRTIGAEFSIEY
jgi:iron complex outermembrane receptor protein